MQNEAIWVIDDDVDDQQLVSEVCKDLKFSNELVFLTSAEQALQKLKEVSVAPFIIFCDVNLPGKNGFTLREKILGHSSKKMRSVPFIYWSTTASEQQITKAYNLSAHGFFIKETTFDEMKESFAIILKYWRKSRMPAKSDHR